jgi:homoserine kinase type II
MAVYTEVTDADLAAFLEDYDLGPVLALKGIAEGVENSNFLLHAEAGYFILTLYERRVEEKNLPFFLGLMEHLAARGIDCPQPVRMRSGGALGRINGRPAAIVTFLEGVSRSHPDQSSCAAVGAALGRLHLAGADFAPSRANALSLDAWPHLFAEVRARADTVKQGTQALIAAELEALSRAWPRSLPRGIVHADLFPDNVLFLGDRLSGLIDFYFACTDDLAYDLAICLNAWCFEPDLSFDKAKARAFFSAYRQVRALRTEEIEAIPILARGAALRFALTRLVDWLNVPPGALVHPKDPCEYLHRLRFLREVHDARELGLEP